MPPVKFGISSDNVFRRAVHIDGEDYSDIVASVDMYVESGQPAEITIGLTANSIPTVRIEGADVHLEPVIVRLLVALGWTPPEHERNTNV